ncbi:MAG: hypothetical protein Q7T03_05695, partial [Deltaproteobacteria bacterium]|nr:hypothetical protein [Deltaproteobacteria bacterium]
MTVDLKTIYNSPQLTSAEKRAVANSNLQDGAPDEPLNGIEVAAQLGVCLVSLGIVCAASCMDSPAVDIYEEHTDGGTTHTIGRNRNNRKANDGDNVSRSQDTQSNISDAGVHKAPGGRLHPRDAGFTSDAHPDAGGFACSPDHETLQVQTNSITERDYRDSDQPSSVWTGSEYAVSWTDFRTRGRNIFFARINPDGTK